MFNGNWIQRQVMGLPDPPMVLPMQAAQIGFRSAPPVGAWPPPLPAGPNVMPADPNQKEDSTPPEARAFDFVSEGLSEDVANNSDLLIELRNLQTRILDRLTEQRQARFDAIVEKRNAMFTRCRELLENVNTLALEFSKLDNIANQWMSEHITNARSVVMAAEASAPPRESFPTREEMAAWEASYATAKRKLTETTEQWREYRSQADKVEGTLRNARKELREATQEEERLTAQIEGRTYRDPRTGFLVK